MHLITDTGDLEAFCRRCAAEPAVVLDTEFVRTDTYWPILCLVQMALADQVVVVDALAPGLDLAPLYALLADPGIIKVFHSVRQDAEIFLKLSGRAPAPLFDTQVAASVLGYGEAVSYEKLVGTVLGRQLDKSLRFSDWRQRPLPERYLRYAADDVLYLHPVYLRLRQDLEKRGRSGWIAEEMAVLHDPATYRVAPADAWRKLRIPAGNKRFRAMIMELAAWREKTAQLQDIPRGRVLRDEVLLAVASAAPADVSDRALAKIPGKYHAGILDAVRLGGQRPVDGLEEKNPAPLKPLEQPLYDLLKVVLRACCADHEVSERMVAGSPDLEKLARGEMPAKLADGWRWDVFGRQAAALLDGTVTLRYDPARRVVSIQGKIL